MNKKGKLAHYLLTAMPMGSLGKLYKQNILLEHCNILLRAKVDGDLL